MKSDRRLAAIMFTDIVGYTAIMGSDEQLGIDAATGHQKIIEQVVPKYQGELIQFYGDGSLSIYHSATFALECAMEIQKEFQKNHKVSLRVGLHIGEILIKEGNIYGDGVNLASRIESLGQAGTILFSEDVFQKIRNNNLFETQLLGAFEFKNVEQPMQVYALVNEGFSVPDPVTITGKLKLPSSKPEYGTLENIGIAKHEQLIHSRTEIMEKSIAVLPFVNMSNDPDQEYFCEGISEEIINTIVQLPNLKVVGRTSSFSLRGSNQDLRSVGKMLGVSKILEGSVRKFGNRVRITTQLVEASSGFHLWSRKYDRELDDIFKIQDEISLEIANQLEITFGGVQTRPKSRQQTQNIEAYQLYYKGRSYFYQRGMSLFEALVYFQDALKIDPGYALASSGLADTYIMLSFHGYLSPAECWAKAIPAAQNALKHGPDLGETHNTLAIIALLHDHRLEVAGKEFKQALKLNPTHQQARVWYGFFYLSIARAKLNEGIEQSRITIENDPLSAYAHACYALNLTIADRLEEAVLVAKYAVELDPDAWISRYTLSYCYMWSGELDRALHEQQIALKISSRHAWGLYLILLIYLKMDKRREALKIFSEMEARYRDHYLPPSILAMGAAAIGKERYALELAHKSVDIIDPYLPNVITIYKDGEALRKVPGFEKILERLGYTIPIP